MFGWPLVSIMLFLFMRPRRAVLVSILGGWLFLPQIGFEFQGLPEYTRFTAVCIGTLFAAALFDSGRLLKFRPHLVDVPMAVWCLVPFASSVTNGLGAYDGVSAVWQQMETYGIPYFLGRVYFSDRDGLRDLAVAIVLGALVYVPFIVYEWRMSPQLHQMVYGFRPIKFHMIWRLGWYRPIVFLSHGLELGVFMALAALIAVWFWRTRVITHLLSVPMSIIAPVLVGITILCRSLNGYGVLMIGMCCVFSFKWWRMRLALIALLLLPCAYVTARVAMEWRAGLIVDQVERFVNVDRAASMRSRIAHEITLVDRALQRPAFGWGGWNRNRADGELAEGAMGNRSVTDSLWIITIGQKGLVGLIAIGLVLALPLTCLLIRVPPCDLLQAAHSIPLVVAVLPALFAVDCLFNAMVNPVYLVAAGGAVGFATAIRAPVLRSIETRNPHGRVTTVTNRVTGDLWLSRQG